MALVMKRGSKGSDVRRLQTALNHLECFCDHKRLLVDGIFGVKTLCGVGVAVDRHVLQWFPEDREGGTVPRPLFDEILHCASAVDPKKAKKDDEALIVAGLDISGHDGKRAKQAGRTIDFDAMAEAGCMFVITKTVELSNRGHYVHDPAPMYADETRASGMRSGSYGFPWPASKYTPRQFADHLLINLIYEPGDIPPALDCEKGARKKVDGKWKSIRTRDAHNRNVEYWLECGRLLSDELHVRIGAYTTWPSLAHYAVKADADLREAFVKMFWKWLADYSRGHKGSGDTGIPGDPVKGTGQWRYVTGGGEFVTPDLTEKKLLKYFPGWETDIYQWTGQGRHPGLTGKCDRNLSREDTLRTLCATYPTVSG